MSHLSTLIRRYENHGEDHALMDQFIRNIREYPEVWDDATEEELERRAEILQEVRG